MQGTMQGPPPMYRPVQQPAAAPQNQIVCSGCSTLLMYPQGASNVRCSRCHHITAVSQSGPEMAQLVCSGCCVLLMYPRGASSVQCSRCSAVNSAVQPQPPQQQQQQQQPPHGQLGHVVCGGCNVTLMYAFGAQSVKCALCNFVTSVQGAPVTMYHPGGVVPPPGALPPPQQMKPITQAVVVENPSTLDEHGNEVPNIAVGMQKAS